MRGYIEVKTYTFVFQMKCYSLGNACPQQECSFLRVSMQSSENNFGHLGDPGCGMLSQSPHEALSVHLVVDHVFF